MNTDTPPLNTSMLAALRTQLRGALVLPGDTAYEAARRGWNAAIDRRPSAIVICADSEDVVVALRNAAHYALPLTVRGGGHNVAGRSVRDGVLMLDLSRLRRVTVNPESRIAHVQGGALWRDLDAATSAHGLATTGGFVSSTGVGGLTLGGGVGWLMRKYGLACDNLRSASLSLADGRTVRASSEEHPDLYWGLRGGGGGLGIVTSFEFHLHPVRDVMAGLVIHPAERALDALRAFRDFAAIAADEFCGIAVIANAPPLPFLDVRWHGKPVVIFAVCWCGDMADGARALAPLREHGHPLTDHIGAMPYVKWQQMQDAGAPAGASYYWKTANFLELNDGNLLRLAEAAARLPTQQSEIHLQHLGGAVARVAGEETAFAHREARFFVNLIGRSEDPAEVPALRERIRALHDNVTDGALPGLQPNFADQDDSSDVRRYGPAHAARLRALRARYDPSGLLCESMP